MQVQRSIVPLVGEQRKMRPKRFQEWRRAKTRKENGHLPEHLAAPPVGKTAQEVCNDSKCLDRHRIPDISHLIFMSKGETVGQHGFRCTPVRFLARLGPKPGPTRRWKDNKLLLAHELHQRIFVAVKMDAGNGSSESSPQLD